MNFSAVCPTTWKISPRCVSLRGKMLGVVSHNADKCSTLCPTMRKNSYTVEKFIHCGKIHTMGTKYFKTLKPLMSFRRNIYKTGWNGCVGWAIFPRCGTHRGKLLRSVSPTAKRFIHIVGPRCVPQHGNFSAVCPITCKIAPRCVPLRRKLLRGVSHNVENCSALWDTPWKIAPRCVPQRGKSLFLEYLPQITK